MKTTIRDHKHTWVVTTIAIALAILLVVLIPENQGYSMFLIGLAGGHLILALIAIFTGWILIPQRFLDKVFKKKQVKGFDFGYSPKWIYSYGIASAIVFMLAVHVFFSSEGSPVLQFSLYTALLLFSVNLFIGYVIFRNSKRQAELTLPMVTLLPEGRGTILDAGCGAGRTTVAIAKALPIASIVSFDRFDAGYIENGGSLLFKNNVSFAGISERVEAVQGDITETPFIDNRFDAAVSSYMFDHLGKNKQKALKETNRTLKPGGRFLLIIAVRSYSLFGIAGPLSLFFPSGSQWKKSLEEAGFKVISDGKINEGSYFLSEK